MDGPYGSAYDYAAADRHQDLAAVLTLHNPVLLSRPEENAQK